MEPVNSRVHDATYQAVAVVSGFTGKANVFLNNDLDSYEKIHARIADTWAMLELVD